MSLSGDEPFIFIISIIPIYLLLITIMNFMDENINKISKDEKLFLFLFIIISFLLAIIFTIFSTLYYPFAKYSLIIDILRRLFWLFLIFLSILIGYIVTIYGWKTWSKIIIPLMVAIILASPALNSFLIKPIIEQSNRLPFNESVFGGVYLWNNQSNNRSKYENLFIVMLILGTDWLSPWPTNFILEFNDSKHINCYLSTINFKGGTSPSIQFYNNHSCVNVTWRESDFTEETGFFNQLWIEFNLSYNSNLSVVYPSYYEIMVDGPYGLTNVCWGLLCHNPEEPSFHSKYWEQQIYDFRYNKKYSCKNCIIK